MTDATWALEAAVGSRLLGAPQGMACDVSGDGSVSAFDAARILRHLAGALPRFPVAQACASDWLFVPAAAAPGGVPPLIQSGSCEPGFLDLTPLLGSVEGADFDAAIFGDCDLGDG